MSIIRMRQFPDSANKNDLFVDEWDGNKIYRCSEDYASEKAKLEIPAEYRPGSSALIFEALQNGFEGEYIRVEIINGGTNGTAGLTISGEGTRESPRVYSFTLYEDDGSNDRVIQLLQGDGFLTVTGTDGDEGTQTGISATALSTGIEERWDAVELRVEYAGFWPPLSGPESSLPPTVHPIVKEALADALAARMLETAGEDPDKALNLNARFETALRQGNSMNKAPALPGDIYPG